MILGLDIDDVVADFLPSFFRFVQKRIRSSFDPLGIDASSLWSTLTDQNFMDHPHLCQKLVQDCMVAVSYDADFWRGLPSLLSPREWEYLEHLSREGRLLFITNRYVRANYDIHLVTCEWLTRHGIGKPVVHFAQNSKADLVRKLEVGLFVDDRYDNCVDVAEKTEAAVFMFHRPYNQFAAHPRVKRIWNLSELSVYLDGKRS